MRSKIDAKGNRPWWAVASVVSIILLLFSISITVGVIIYERKFLRYLYC